MIRGSGHFSYWLTHSTFQLAVVRVKECAQWIGAEAERLTQATGFIDRAESIWRKAKRASFGLLVYHFAADLLQLCVYRLCTGSNQERGPQVASSS